MIENLFSNKIKKKELTPPGSNKFQFLFMTCLLFNLACAQSEDSPKDGKRLCAHSSYPCFYYYCDDRYLLNEKSKIFKCAKGLIYDEKIQHCVWAMPWQTCTLSEKTDLFKSTGQSSSVNSKVISTRDKPFNKTQLNVVETRPSIVYTGNKKIAEKVSNSLFESLALSLKLKDLPQSNLNGLSSLPIENRFDVMISSPNEKRQIQAKPEIEAVFNGKKIVATSSKANNLNVKNMIQVSDQVEYYDSDFNVTIDSADEEQDGVEFDEQAESNSDQYAYIVVPIKISKNRKLPDLLNPSATSHRDSNKKKNKNNKIMKETKNLEDMFKYKKICYVTNWSQYRPKPAQFTPENVDPFLCTHLIYAFAYIDNHTLTMRTIEENDEEMYKRVNDLKYKNPKLKTMLGVGGWNMKSREFSRMVRNVFTRENFINHAIRFLRYYNFDGIDLDWEFPGERGGSDDDKPNFTLLLKEFRQAINDEAYAENKPPLILSIAVPAARERIEKGYEIKKIVSELDFINIMTFDYRGSWDATTGLNAPLYGHENVTSEDSETNQDWSVSYWIKNGCPPHKIVLGLPAYGRSFYLKDKNQHGLASSCHKNATYGNFTKTSGFLSYYEICQLKKEKNWTNVWLPQSKSNYMYRGNDWISYDDIKSFHLRTAYVVAKKLAGIFIWSIDMDDFSGKFCNLGSYPLIKNSMSLLMDYLPEWYSSNVNQPKKSVKQKQQQQQEVANPSKIFYILKDDPLNLDDMASKFASTSASANFVDAATSASLSSLLSGSPSSQHLTGSGGTAQEFDLIKQNRIRNDLLNLLTQQPNKFASFNLPDTFNCSSKQKGFHRDPFDCTKYYFCSESSQSSQLSQSSSANGFLFSKSSILPMNRNLESNLIQVKAYTCPKNTVFNMNGCYCEKETNQNVNCHYLSETYCDFGLFRNVDKKFS